MYPSSLLFRQKNRRTVNSARLFTDLIIFCFYNTNFLINTIPPASIIKTVNPNAKYVFTLPVAIDNITGASSISSSPSFLLSGVESLSGTPLSL